MRVCSCCQLWAFTDLTFIAMGRKSKKTKAPSGVGPSVAAKTEVAECKTVPTKGPQNAEDAAVSTIRQFYDKLIQLPLDEKAPELYSHYLITSSTLERMCTSCYIRADRNGFILRDVLQAVQQKPDLLEVFCNLLQNVHIAAELAQLIKEKYDEEIINLKDTATHITTSTKTGPATFEKILQGKGVIVVLLLLLAVALAPWYTMKYQIPRPGPHSGKIHSLPDLPTAFTGRSDEIHRLIHYVMTEHVSIVAVTGGPGYGKSSVAIVSGHELARLGVPVYYVSLSEVTSIETFIMAFVHATVKMKTEQMPERHELLSWVSSLKTKTVVVLDNADLLTLRQTGLKNDFQEVLKAAVAASAHIHLVIATRYRFIIANDFEEIHLNPLTSAEAVTLLRRVVVHGDRRGGYVEDEHLKSIANETGGIPLAVKVVGMLVKSGIVSTTQVLEELAVDPLHIFSRDSVSPDEQLNRCFNLSYKYLSPIMRKCLIYASRFPDTFDRQARDAIITKMAGDAHCLDQLVDRSLVEYSTVEERYAMHSLLRSFVLTSVKGRSPKDKYFRLFCSHFTLLLSTRITEASTGGDVNPLYATITADYQNFLHLLDIYTNESKYHTCMGHKDMLLFANQAFDVMKSRFPWELLMDWWTAVLKNVCRRIRISEFEQLAVRFLQLITKFGNLLLYHKQYKWAGDILLFADQCVNDTTLASFFTTCQHPEAGSYTSMLLALMKVHEENGLIQQALQVRERLHHCVDSSPDKKPEDLIPDNFCTVGIAYLQETHLLSKDCESALHLFDAHFKCFKQSEESSDNLIKMFEDACEQDSVDRFERLLGIAKRYSMVKHYRKESTWLMKALTFEELMEDELGIPGIISVHFRLTRLHWWALGNAEKAVEHGRAAYSLAIMNPRRHFDIWATSLRLGDILHQMNGRHTEAGFYFEEALKHFPFVNLANQDVVYIFLHFAELHLISIHYHTGEHRQCIQHYGQWANLNIAHASDHAGQIINALYKRVWEGNSQGLAVRDSSLDWLSGDARIAERFLDAFVQKAHSSTLYYARVFGFILILFVGGFIVIMSTIYFCTKPCVSVLTLIFTRMAYIIFLPHFCFHYFCYEAFKEHRIWAPRQLPQYHPLITQIYATALFVSTLLGALIMYVSSFVGMFLLGDQIGSVYSPNSLYYNISIHIPDETFYNHLI